MSEMTSLAQERAGRGSGVLCEEHVLKCQVSVLCVFWPNTQHCFSQGPDMIANTCKHIHYRTLMPYTWLLAPIQEIHTRRKARCSTLTLGSDDMNIHTTSQRAQADRKCSNPLPSTPRHTRTPHTDSCIPAPRNANANQRGVCRRLRNKKEGKKRNSRMTGDLLLAV